MPRRQRRNSAGARTPHKQHRGLEGSCRIRDPAQRQNLDGREPFTKRRLRCQRCAAAEVGRVQGPAALSRDPGGVGSRMLETMGGEAPLFPARLADAPTHLAMAETVFVSPARSLPPSFGFYRGTSSMPRCMARGLAREVGRCWDGAESKKPTDASCENFAAHNVRTFCYTIGTCPTG